MIINVDHVNEYIAYVVDVIILCYNLINQTEF
jgi:hypothetical protein